MTADPGPLASIPELQTQDDMTAWLEAAVRQTNALQIENPDTVDVFSFSLHDENPEELPPTPVILKKFTLAVLLADWSCYADPANREDYGYLRNVLAVSPWGFRLWTARVDGNCLPIGYTGFHPISKDTFHKLKASPESITSRMQITPIAESNSMTNYFYIYNIGIIKQFHRTTASKRLVKKFSNDIASANARALAAIVVSPDGKRIIGKFGLHQTGFISHAGHKESAYVSDDDYALCE